MPPPLQRRATARISANSGWSKAIRMGELGARIRTALDWPLLDFKVMSRSTSCSVIGDDRCSAPVPRAISARPISSG